MSQGDTLMDVNLFVSMSRLESMKDGMLELEMAVPALKLDASASASLKKVNGLVLQLETAFNVLEASSLQKAILRYGTTNTNFYLFLFLT